MNEWINLEKYEKLKDSDNMPTKLFEINKKYFENIVKTIGCDDMNRIFSFNLKGIVYNKCFDIANSICDQLQSNFIIGVYTTNDIAHYYLEKVDNKKFQKYKDTDDFYFVNHKKHYKLKKNCNTIFQYKDKNFIIVKRDESKCVYLYFVGNNRIKHYENYLRFFNKYKENNMSITITNMFKDSTGKLNQTSTSTIGRNEASVVYKGKDELFNFLDSWIESMEYMYSLSLSHKIGILLCGNPGTGKTSLAKMIATKYNLNIVKINFNAISEVITNEDCLEKLNNSMVLIEDIDCLVTSRDGSNDSLYKENFQALLQLLDGIKTFKKTIFVATTNYEEKLDEALIRDGRFDIKIHMKDMNKEDASKLCRIFNVSEKLIEDEEFPINPAYLQNKITTHLFKNIKRKWGECVC